MPTAIIILIKENINSQNKYVIWILKLYGSWSSPEICIKDNKELLM